MTGFDSKRAAAADKMHWSDCAVHNGPAYPAGKCDCGVAQEPESEALKLLEEATRSCNNIDEQRALDALMLDFHKPAQEPVAFSAEIVAGVNGTLSTQWADWWTPNEGDKLYTAPPQRPWVGLTGEEIDELAEWHGLDLMMYVPFTEAIEAKLKEKNNGT